VQVLSAADLVVMVILTTYSDHGNVIVSARSVHLVVNGNASSSGTLIGQTQQQAEDCQTLSHGVLWRRFDIDIPGSAKQHEAFDALAEDDKIAVGLCYFSFDLISERNANFLLIGTK